MRCIFLLIGGPGGGGDIFRELVDRDGFLRLLPWLGGFLPELDDERSGGSPGGKSPSERLELRVLLDAERPELFVVFTADRFDVDVDVLLDVGFSPVGGSGGSPDEDLPWVGGPPGPSPFSAPHEGGISGPFVVIGIPYLFKAQTSEEIRAFVVLAAKDDR